jgi:hypothetical protein
MAAHRSHHESEDDAEHNLAPARLNRRPSIAPQMIPETPLPKSATIGGGSFDPVCTVPMVTMVGNEHRGKENCHHLDWFQRCCW